MSKTMSVYDEQLAKLRSLPNDELRKAVEKTLKQVASKWNGPEYKDNLMPEAEVFHRLIPELLRRMPRGEAPAGSGERGFKIRNKDGKWRGPGYYGGFTSRGKTWHRLADALGVVRRSAQSERWVEVPDPTYHRGVRSERVQFSKEEFVHQMDAQGVEVVEFELVERRRIPAREILAGAWED